MTTPARVLRRTAISTGRMPPLSAKEAAEQQLLFERAGVLLTTYGRAQVSFATLAVEMRVSRGRLVRHFADMDELFVQILHAYLAALEARLRAAMPATEAALRMTYLTITRQVNGTLTPWHQLLVRDGHNLPPDLRAEIAASRARLASLFGGTQPQRRLDILDHALTHFANVESVLAIVEEREPPPRTATLH